jgi:hypothetical protein
MEVRAPIVYRGVREISAAAGLNWKRFRHYVDEMDLPVFRIEGVGPWLAMPEDLARWVEEQRDQDRSARRAASAR